MRTLRRALIENYQYNPIRYVLEIIGIFIICILYYLIAKGMYLEIAAVPLFIFHFIMMNLRIRKDFYNQRITDLLEEKQVDIETLQDKMQISKYEFRYKKGKYEFYVSNKQKKKYISLLESL
ncbi:MULTISPECIES: hypothetical protein [Mammaliicoccus]|uniref:hypothetical protein n=2 Tax=Staphylococcaceae TaxID=90964 RepID=UPI000D1C96FB|nr:MULTISPECIES: hypothetical protein [Mammaliicoccus]MBW0764330.1 hypothetical protein [Mammaliicoccus fleurettii]PTE34087.1 hypothetical protein BUY94_04970 [Mammaliicoccus fleurettii]SUM37826.1 Uncharacterised protein [Mammaliicoccus fleurettii]HCN60040.1 hypothetical protein [Staphylococcus sp.]